MQDKKLYLIANFDSETQNILAGYYNILMQNGFIGNQTKNIPYHFTLGFFLQNLLRNVNLTDANKHNAKA